MSDFFTTRDHKLAPGKGEDWRKMYRREAEEEAPRIAREGRMAEFVQTCLAMALVILILSVKLAAFVGLVWLALQFLE